MRHQPDKLQTWIGRLGGLAALAAFTPIFLGLWRGTKRPRGRSSGNVVEWLRRPAFYFWSSLAYIGACAASWRPLPRLLPPSAVRERLSLLIGALLYFPGLALMLWGRLALGRMYFVSTTGGAQLFADHQLITRGPYSWVRHPMYLGLSMAGLGSLLIYRTWTCLWQVLIFPALVVRGRREELVLAAEFGESWEAYRRRVPAWLPRLHWPGRQNAEIGEPGRLTPLPARRPSKSSRGMPC